MSINVTADVVTLPPCDYSVTPTAISLGQVTPGDHRDLVFTVQNQGTSPSSVCLLSGVDLAPGSDPAFSLPDGAIGQEELAPGQRRDIRVRAAPQGPLPSGVVPLTGAVTFYLSSDVRPVATVDLSAQVAPTCLSVTPGDFDFGTVKGGCSAAIRTFNLYSNCAHLTLNRISVVRPAGEVAGGPNCPGPSDCPEFTLMQTPTLPAGGLAMTPGWSGTLSFQAKYRPVDLGPDTGVVAIDATQGGQNLTYLVVLTGNSDLLGVQTDTVSLAVKPKADVLFVIDDSCSMTNKQPNLAANIVDFMSYAQAKQVDFQLAATTADMGFGSPQGRFISGPSHPEKILLPTTPELIKKLSAKLTPGTFGSGDEREAQPALAALTPPLSETDNAGFLRPDASLSVVAFSDEADGSPGPTSYYLDRFWSIKGQRGRNLFTFNAIDAFSPACVQQSQSGDGGELAFYVAQTNGVAGDICTGPGFDWTA